MPLLGYFLGTTFEGVVTNIDHWIAFILLSIIGIKMVKESFSKETQNYNDDVSVKTMLILSIATSIDALAVEITFAFFNVNLVLAISLIAIITFILSFRLFIVFKFSSNSTIFSLSLVYNTTFNIKKQY